jgi:predicted regulator of Ras-like GTPase activity (Roadblock/LC7/MglB family)
VTEQSDNLAAALRPYRETPGIRAAMLISRDGFVVASDADEAVDREAIAAQLGGLLDIGGRLARELGQQATRYFFIELDDQNVMLAPFGDELLLVLLGERATLTCDYRLGRRP